MSNGSAIGITAELKDKAERFLKEKKFVVEDINIFDESELFGIQMEMGLTSSKGLPMIPTYIDGDIRPKQGVKAIAVDVGGTNLRVAVAELSEKNTIISNVLKSEVLGKEKPVTFEFFLEDLVNKVIQYLPYSDTVCLSFSHEIEHTNDLDGMVYKLSKEVTITGIERKLLAESLRQAVFNKTGKHINTVLINDTVGVAAAMLQMGETYQNYFGVVLGTGMNACYIEKCENITKINDAKTKTMYINMEAGDFIPSNISSVDKVFDATTAFPQTAVLEKMVSGEYLGKLFFFLIREACESGLFTEAFAEKIKKHKPYGTEEFSRYYADHEVGVYANLCTDEQDRQLLWWFANRVVERAARLLTALLIGIAKKIYRSVDLPICVVMEGTTYYGLKGFESRVRDLLDAHANGIIIELAAVQDAALVGIGNIGLAFA